MAETPFAAHDRELLAFREFRSREEARREPPHFHRRSDIFPLLAQRFLYNGTKGRRWSVCETVTCLSRGAPPLDGHVPLGRLRYWT